MLTEETINVGRAISYGVEATVSARPVARFRLSASAGYLNAHWRDREAMVDLQSVDGRRLPFAPQFTASGDAQYTAPLFRDLELRLSAGASFNGGFYWDAANSARQPSYAIVDLRAAIVDSRSGLELWISSRNTGNAHYHTEYVADVFGPGASLGATGSPATVSIGARVAW